MNYPLTALISDLHANQPALETALSDARARGAQRFVCLGDVIGYGARPRECLDWVMRLCTESPMDRSAGGDRSAEGDRSAAGDSSASGGGQALMPGLCLLGNHEYALLHSAEDFNPKARAAIEWTREELNRGEHRDANYGYWEFLDTLSPAKCDAEAMFAHGSPRDPVREYMLPRDIQNHEKMAANFARMERNVCFVGHSHVPAIYYEDGRLFRPRGTEGPYSLEVTPKNRAIVNVGSVGQPRDGDPRLSYVMFDGVNVTFVRLEYDHAAAAAAIRAVPELPEFLAERLALGR